MSHFPEKWLIIDDVFARLSYDSFCAGTPREAAFVKRVHEVQEALACQEFDVLSLDYHLDKIGAGTTQPLVDWLITPAVARRFVGSLRLNVHSFDQQNAPRIMGQLAAAGYTVTSYRI